MKSAFAVLIVCLSCAGAWAGGIPIHISRDTLPAVVPAPVKCGVPLPKGAYNAGDPIMLVDDTGASQTLQTRVLATWDPEGKQGVRWLLVDFLADPSHAYTLRFSGEAAPAASPVASETDDAVTIDTGPLKGTISRTAFDPFSGLQVNGAPVVQPPGATAASAFNGFYIQHETKGIFRADLDREAIVTLEETGPIRACIKAAGWYTNEQGEQFGRFAIRMHFTRGSSTVRVLHTFIYTGLSAEDRVTDVGLQLEHCPESYTAGYGTWGTEPIEQGMATGGYARTQNPHVAIVQDSYDRDHIEFKQIDLDTGAVMGSGEKLGGWFRLTARPVVLTAAIKDAWQQYPFEFEFDHRVARIHLWPKHGRMMDLSWDGYWWWLTDRQKRHLAQNKPHKEENLDDWMKRLRERTNATGAAKTHELSLTWHDTRQFDREGRPPSGWALARDVATPVYAWPDLTWASQTRALDWCLHAPPDMTARGAEERYARALLHLMQSAVEQRHYYGYWDFGGYHQHLLGYRPGQREDDGGLGTWHRARPKSHYGWGTFAWLNYYRTGDRAYRDYARTYTLYSADRAFCHHTDHGRIAGAEYHYDNSEIHWLGGWMRSPGGDIPSSNLQQKDDYVFNYWLTGDRRPLDVLELWGSQMIEQGHLTGAWIDAVANVTHGNQNRNAGMVLHRLCMLYQATWDKRFLDAATRVADAFAQIDTLEKVRLVEMMNVGDNPWHASSGWAYDGLWQYWNLTGDARIRNTLDHYCRRAALFLSGSARGDEYRTFSALTYGYELTGDRMYLDLGKAACDRLIGQWINTSSFNPGPKHDNVVMMRFVGMMANAQGYTPRDYIDFRYAPRQGRTNHQPARLHLREQTDGEWSIDLVVDSGGIVTVTAPDGREVVRQNVERLDGTYVTLHVPSDGMTGDYIVASEGISDAVHKYLHHSFVPYACLIRKPAGMKAVVELPNTPNAANPLRGRAFYFQAPAGGDDMALAFTPTEGALRNYAIEQVDGHWRATTDALLLDAEGAYTVPLPSDAKAHLYRLSAETPADAYYPHVESPGGYFMLRNVPPYVSASPEEWFNPQAGQ